MREYNWRADMTEPKSRSEDYSFTVIGEEEAYRSAEEYWRGWRAGKASVKPFTPGFPDLTARYDPDAGAPPLGAMEGDAVPAGPGGKE